MQPRRVWIGCGLAAIIAAIALTPGSPGGNQRLIMSYGGRGSQASTSYGPLTDEVTIQIKISDGTLERANHIQEDLTARGWDGDIAGDGQPSTPPYVFGISHASAAKEWHLQSPLGEEGVGIYWLSLPPMLGKPPRQVVYLNYTRPATWAERTSFRTERIFRLP